MSMVFGRRALSDSEFSGTMIVNRHMDVLARILGKTTDGGYIVETGEDDFYKLHAYNVRYWDVI